MIHGPEIIARTLSNPNVAGRNGRRWQYNSRSDHHSKVACWAVMFDLLSASSLLQKHVREGKVGFGINRELNDWASNRRKNLDLVVARTDGAEGKATVNLAKMAADYRIDLSEQEAAHLAELPSVGATSVAGATVLVALEAKACMTSHIKARPRLYDELTSSYQTVHGDNAHALAIGLVMVNHAPTFISPDLNKVIGVDDVISEHRQPHCTEQVIAKVEEIRRRPGPASNQPGFDALGILTVDLRNDGSAVDLVSESPAPQPNSPFHYASMIRRAAQVYDTSFGNV